MCKLYVIMQELIITILMVSISEKHVLYVVMLFFKINLKYNIIAFL